MFERAGNVLELFAGNGIGERPIAFVTHSLGGILTKMILRKSCEAEDEDWRRVSEATKLVVFLSTPHTGAAVANMLNVVPLTSKHVKLLANEFSFLEDLNDQYRTLANSRDDLATAVYYEKHAANKSIVVVSRESADPGVAKTRPVPVDKDHINICKPPNPEDIVYLGVKRHIQKVVKSVEQRPSATAGLIAVDDYEERSTKIGAISFKNCWMQDANMSIAMRITPKTVSLAGTQKLDCLPRRAKIMIIFFRKSKHGSSRMSIIH